MVTADPNVNEKGNESGKMKKESGDLSIEMSNLFDILKKWMYSEKDIFLRELIANSLDAIRKLQNIISFGDYSGTVDGEISLSLDEEGNALTISDNGLGMTAGEVRRYINQIAFSGINDFVKKYVGEEEEDGNIGFFGIGFYSVFMVADRVAIVSRSYKEGSEAVKWSCDGSPRYTLTRGERKEIGTDVTVYLDEDNREYTKGSKIREIVRRHCRFLPIPIKLDDEILNEPDPLWKKNPSDVEKEEYVEFYKRLYDTYEEPHFWLHLKIDYPFDLKGILYFPRLKREMESPQESIKIYSNQMFVTDHSKELVPEFLTLLQGAIDSPDLPLNISRSMLQQNPIVLKIGRVIVGEVAKKLKGMYGDDRERYEEMWEEINPVIKYGCMRDGNFHNKVKDILIYKTTEGGYTTLEDYSERNAKENDGAVFYASDPREQGSYLDLIKEHDLEALIMDSVIDAHFIQFLEGKNSDIRFSRVDSDISRFLKKEGDEEADEDGDGDEKPLKKKKVKIEEIFNKYLDDPDLTVKAEELKTQSVPGMLVIEEHMRRFEDMSKLWKTDGGSFKAGHVLVVNTNNPIIKNVLKLYKGRKKDRVERMKDLCNTVYDVALLRQGKLEGEGLSDFVQRYEKVLEKYSEM